MKKYQIYQNQRIQILFHISKHPGLNFIHQIQQQKYNQKFHHKKNIKKKYLFLNINHLNLIKMILKSVLDSLKVVIQEIQIYILVINVDMEKLFIPMVQQNKEPIIKMNLLVGINLLIIRVLYMSDYLINQVLTEKV